jgi:Fe-S-cluster-containing hydrogenase component 2
MAIIVKEERCPQNHPCPAIRVCPVDAIHQAEYNAPMVDQDICISCGKCVRACPMDAFQVVNSLNPAG